jgi:regulator of protease activity HflC (stomatin/prohibitin superfamily)
VIARERLQRSPGAVHLQREARRRPVGKPGGIIVAGPSLIFLGIVVVIAIALLTATVKVVQEYERGVVFRLGRYVGARGPGLIILIPYVERMVKVDLRVITLDVPSQEVITRDNVTIKVNAVVYFFVVDPGAAVTRILDYARSTSLVAQTTLRSVLGQVEMDDLLANRERVNAELQRIVDEQTDTWGIKVTSVDVRDVELPDTMKRAMARQAEAEREKRAKIIHAEGEYAAATQLAQAARVINSQEAGLQLRYLQTLTEISSEKNQTVVFPMPVDLVQMLTAAFKNGNGDHSG